MILSTAIIMMLITKVRSSQAAAAAAAAVNCSEYQHSVILNEQLTMDYVVYSDDLDGGEFYLKAQLVLRNHQSWLAFGINAPGSASMIPGEAIIGLPLENNEVQKYQMTNYAASFITKRDATQQTLGGTLLQQNDTMTMLRFTKKLKEDDEYLIRAASVSSAAVASIENSNSFMWAYGFGNNFGYHQARGLFTLELNVCEEPEATESPTQSPTLAPITSTPTNLLPSTSPSNSPSYSPSITIAPSSSPTTSPSVTPTTLLSTSSPSVSLSTSPSTSLQPTTGAVDCTQYQRLLQLNEQLQMQYVVYENEYDNNELYLKAQLILEGQAWIGFGINKPGSSSMVPGESIIAIPTPESILTRNTIEDTLRNKNVQKYSLGAYSPQGVQPFPQIQQTLNNTWVEQNDTMTIMRFTKKLTEENEFTIHASVGEEEGEETRINNFMWAYGFGNTLGFHAQFGAFALTLRVCSPDYDVDGDSGFVNLDVGESYQNLWAVHGLLATLAWGVLSPLAIGSAMLRRYLTCSNDAGLWYKCHYYLNLMTMLLTMISFGIAVVAHQGGTPEGEDPKHFAAFAHATVGLIIMIAVSVQVINGLSRPHATKEGEMKKPIRSLWEYGHRILGVVLVGVCWYQIQDGMTIYSTKFNQTDYTTIFWSITGSLSGFIVVVYTRSKISPQAADDDDDNKIIPYTSAKEQHTVEELEIPVGGKAENDLTKKEENSSSSSMVDHRSDLSC